MRSLSGLILDVYDDTHGELFRGIYPELTQVPGAVKVAHYLTPDERAKLPDDVFSLILEQGDTRLRKYACTDAGNTIMSVEYFLRTHPKLPTDATKLAAHNLQIACSWYGLPENRQLYKLAGIGGIALNALKGLGGKALGYASKVVKDPMGALGTAGTVMAVGGALGDAKRGLQTVANQEAGQMGNIIKAW